MTLIDVTNFLFLFLFLCVCLNCIPKYIYLYKIFSGDRVWKKVTRHIKNKKINYKPNFVNKYIDRHISSLNNLRIFIYQPIKINYTHN
jgi:hypothetical protein